MSGTDSDDSGPAGEESSANKDNADEDKALFAVDENSHTLDVDRPDLNNFEEEFKELLPSTDNPFDYWISEETGDQNDRNGSANDKDDVKIEPGLFENDEELDDPFEEFLEIQDEHGLITPEGELDYEIVDQLLQSKEDSGNHNGNGSFDKNLVNDVPSSEEEVEKREEDEKHISLDELVTVSNDEEPLFAQRDEEFDTLLKDAVSNDEKIQQLLNENSKVHDSLHEINNNIEAVLLRASELYHESRYDDAVGFDENFSEDDMEEDYSPDEESEEF